jgi:hypothetical protein
MQAGNLINGISLPKKGTLECMSVFKGPIFVCAYSHSTQSSFYAGQFSIVAQINSGKATPLSKAQNVSDTKCGEVSSGKIQFIGFTGFNGFVGFIGFVGLYLT